MKHDQSSGSPGRLPAISGKILRNVELHAQSFALIRPGRAVSVPLSTPISTPLSCAKVEAVQKRPPQPDIEQLLLEARETSYAAGYKSALKISHETEVNASHDVRAAAEKSGYEEGYRKGMQAAKEEAGTILQDSEAALRTEWAKKAQHLEEMLQKAAAQMPTLVGEAEEEIVALVFEAVSGVLGEALATAQGIRGMVESLVARQARRTQITAHLHPQDWAMVVEAFKTESGLGPALEWVSDPQVVSGGVVLHHAQGRLDASLDTVMRNLQATLLRVRQDRMRSASAPTSLVSPSATNSKPAV